MKTINIHLEDKEHKELETAKGKLTWKEVLMNFLKKEDNKNE